MFNQWYIDWEIIIWTILMKPKIRFVIFYTNHKCRYCKERERSLNDVEESELDMSILWKILWK